MRTLTLIDPQPMETLPAHEHLVFAEVTTNIYDEKYVTQIGGAAFHKGYYAEVYTTIHAWSYTATFAEEGGEG